MKSISIYRLNAIFLFVILTTIVLYYGKEFLVPLFFAILLAMLLLPVCNKLEKWGLGRVTSTFAGMFLIVAFVAGIVGIIAAQGASLSDDWPKMQEKVQQFSQQGKELLTTKYGITAKEQESYVQKGKTKMEQSGGQFFQKFFSGMMGFLTAFVLTLLYFFFLMWKREKYREFFLKLVHEENRKEVKKELDQISDVAGMYLIGRLISMVFLAVFYMVGFSIVGLENGLLIALVAVLPTIVPYVGAFIGGFFPIAMAFVGGSTDMILPIAGILIVAQIIDNNIIEPLVEGESLDISPIWTIVSIVLGELVWGIPGMILFMPMFAILKIICDHIPTLHPFSFLLENEMDEPKWLGKVKGLFGKS
ncbi:MAG TPA: AI-2E family transporter [Flavobacterium sp.]|jgi:predicted PurR-regulated permease PerM